MGNQKVPDSVEVETFYANETAVYASDKDYCVLFQISVPINTELNKPMHAKAIQRKFVYLSNTQAERLAEQLSKTISKRKEMVAGGISVDSMYQETAKEEQ